MATAIFKCTCTNPYQDRIYGIGKRVYNSKKEGGQWRCTVCKKEYTGKVEQLS